MHTSLRIPKLPRHLLQVRGDAAVREWKQLQEYMKPYAAAASAVPPAAIRADLGAAATALARYSPSLLTHGGRAGQLVQPFSDLVKGIVRDPFIKNWLDLLCFLLSGLPANGTIAAEVRPRACRSLNQRYVSDTPTLSSAENFWTHLWPYVRVGHGHNGAASTWRGLQHANPQQNAVYIS